MQYKLLFAAALVMLLAGHPYGALAQAGNASLKETAPAAEEKYVVLWRRVPSDFNSSRFDASRARQLIDSSPSRKIRLSPGDTISGQLRQNFKISSSWTPAMYDSMIAKIVELNALQSADSVIAGQALIVPVVPMTVASGTKQGIRVDWSLSELESSAYSSMSVASSDIAQTEIQYFKVAASDLSSYASEAGFELGASGEITVELGRVLAQDMATSTSPLQRELAELVRAELQDSASGIKAVVVVMDDSIPDHTEYVRTKEFIIELSEQVRTQYGLGESPYLGEVRRLPSTLSDTPSHTLYPDLRMHSSQIKHALTPLTSLDGGQRVRVIYLPLAATQRGVSPFFKEILFLSEMIKMLRPSPGKKSAGVASARQYAEMVVEQIVESNRKVFDYGPVAFGTAASASVASDRGLLEAITLALDAYSTLTANPHALSLSWTMPKLQLPAYLVESPYGWRFAAAGNGRSTGAGSDFIAGELQFAARAATTKDVIAVLNSDGPPGPCASNIFDDSSGIQVLSLAFAGRIDEQRCGTSFSTPRVAWLIAARETVRGRRLSAPVTPQAKVLWNQQQQVIVGSMRSSRETSILQKYSLDVNKLFEARTP